MISVYHSDIVEHALPQNLCSDITFSVHFRVAMLYSLILIFYSSNLILSPFLQTGLFLSGVPQEIRYGQAVHTAFKRFFFTGVSILCFASKLHLHAIILDNSRWQKLICKTV